MDNTRTWIFRGLTLVAAAVLIYTWFQPWWVAYIEELQQNGVTIRPYAMEISGMLRNYPEWIVGAEMPTWFFPLMWVYLGVCLGTLTYSLFTDNNTAARLLVGFAGFAYVVFVVVFAITVAMRAPDFHGVPLQGHVFISMNEHTESYVDTSLQMGYWIACGVGPFLLALAALRTRIVGASAGEAKPALKAKVAL